MKRPLRHIFDYLILSLLMSFSIVLILLFNGNRTFQAITIISMSLLYIIWGFLHELKEGALHQKVILEYILYAILGSVLVLGLL